MQFNDANAGLMTVQSDCLARQWHWAPIREREVSFVLKEISLNNAFKELSFH